MPDQPNIFEAIAQTTVAVMTGAPEHREEWFNHARRVRAQAQATGDLKMVALLDAVLKLLMGDKPETITPDLAGEHAACWDVIIQALKQWAQMQNAPPPSKELLERLHAVTSEEELKALVEEHPELLPYLQQLMQQGGDASTGTSQLEQAVLDFINADTWNESKRIVEERRDLLLTDEADRFFGELLVQHQDDPRAVQILQQHRDLLHRCREEGIDAVFASMLHQSQTGTQSAARDDDELRRILAQLAQPVPSLLDMPRRIELCRHALELVSRHVHPELWAALQVELANSLVQTPVGNRAENLEQAIYHYVQALQVYIRETFPKEWASTQNNLANVYATRIRGERAENLERSIYRYEQALQVYTREAYPKQWAMTQNNLANAYGDRIRGERAENLERAIYRYEQALEVYTREAFPADWANSQNNLANTYRDRILGERTENLEQAIHHCEQALQVYTRDAFPADWARSQNNLAAAYANRVSGERAEDLERAIYHLEQVLQVYTREAFPEQWAMTHNNLAAAYSWRIVGQRAENLERAIHHLGQALEVYARKAFPERWAMTQNNLAATYSWHVGEERAENLERAIHHYEQALQVYTREAFPEKWAMVQHNLANAYSDRIRGNRTENLEQAIHHYEQALEVRTREAFPVEWANSQNSLGDAYRGRIRGEGRENLEQAVYHYEQALQVYTREAFPEQWAIIQTNLAYRHKQRMEEEQAIHHYEQALQVYTREAFPEQWAMVQHNLANAHRDRAARQRAENLERAIHHYEQALEVRTREALPVEYRATQRNLGNVHFSERCWSKALEAYQATIAVGNDLFAAASTEADRYAEVRESSQVYTRAAYCLLQTDQPGGALVMHERGKMRLLSEALAVAEADLSLLPVEQRKRVQERRASVHALEAEMRLPSDTPGRRDDWELARAIGTARTELNVLIDAIREEFPDFMPTGLDLPRLLSLIPEGGALVALMETIRGGAVFVIPHGTANVTAEHVIMIDIYMEEVAGGVLLRAEDGSGWRNWVGAYIGHRHGKIGLSLEGWQRNLDRITGELWDTLLAPVHARLQSLGVTSIILMPANGLQLLPLHAAWRTENGEKRYLLDDYEIVYAPSGYALDVSRRRLRTRSGRSALVVGINRYADPQVSPLVSAVPEARALAELLETQALLDEAATGQAIIEGAAGKSFLHLSCHGKFEWVDPMSSGLICHDAPLTLSDIIGSLNLGSARLVTLSACETGITDVRQSPDEYVGLPAGFLQAGAPAVVSSLWAVDDHSTALLMERFYRNHLQKGMLLPAALREAQLWLRDVTRAELGDYYKSFLRMSKPEAQELGAKLVRDWPDPDDRPYQSPFYWAAFTFSGAG